MNTFFIGNFFFTLLFVFIPLIRLDISHAPEVDIALKFVFSLLLISLIIFRGLKAVEVKNEFLYCNSYPFYNRFRLDDLKMVVIENRKVIVTLRNDTVHEVHYFFGINGAICKSVADEILDLKINF